MSDAGNSGEQRRVIGRPFQPGQSGNPSGRPKGSIRLREILEPALEEVARHLIERAQTGDPQAVKEFLDRVCGRPTVGEPNEAGQQVAEVVYRWAGEGEG